MNVKEKENILKTVMSNWLPVPAAVLGTIVRKLPSPKTAQKSRVNIIWPTLFAIDNADRNRHGDITPQMCNLVRKAVEECDENGPLVIFIAKMVAADKSDIAGVDELLDLAQDTEAGIERTKQYLWDSVEFLVVHSTRPKIILVCIYWALNIHRFVVIKLNCLMETTSSSILSMCIKYSKINFSHS